MQTIQKSTLHKFISLLCAAVLMLGCVFCNRADEKASAYENSDFSDEYGDFLFALGEKESGNDYSALSYDGQYMGRWQIGMLGMQEIGFADSSGNWTSLAASYGATSKETFLASPAAQDYAILATHKRILYYAENMGMTKYIGTNVGGVEMTFAGMIVASHALGIGGLQKLILNGTSGNSGNDSTAVAYMKLCGGYDIENTVRYGALPEPPGDETITTTTTTTTTTTATTTSESTTTNTTTTTEATTVISETTTTATETTVTSATTNLMPPEKIEVKLSSNVGYVGEMFTISVDSDTADKYLIHVSEPDGTNTQYMLTGTSIGIILRKEGVHTVTVTGINSAGISEAEPVYFAVQKKTVVNEENIGDANDDGVVDLIDATLILTYYACHYSGVVMDTEDSFNNYYADVNDDGKIDLVDASLVLSYYAAVSSGKNITWSDILPVA